MQIADVQSLPIPELKIVRFARFLDDRGYFTESYRRSDVERDPRTAFLSGLSFPQSNESFSHAGVVRGLHVQWNPFMGKLVPTVSGRMVDLVLDVRLGSPTVGKLVAYDMPSSATAAWSEWIWVPPGFAHGNFFTESTVIEYLCTGEHSPGHEAAVSPLAPGPRLVSLRPGIANRVPAARRRRTQDLRQGPRCSLAIRVARRRALEQLSVRRAQHPTVRVLVFGSSGQLGSDVAAALRRGGETSSPSLVRMPTLPTSTRFATWLAARGQTRSSTAPPFMMSPVARHSPTLRAP